MINLKKISKIFLSILPKIRLQLQEDLKENFLKKLMR